VFGFRPWSGNFGADILTSLPNPNSNFQGRTFSLSVRQGRRECRHSEHLTAKYGCASWQQFVHEPNRPAGMSEIDAMGGMMKTGSMLLSNDVRKSFCWQETSISVRPFESTTNMALEGTRCPKATRSVEIVK